MNRKSSSGRPLVRAILLSLLCSVPAMAERLNSPSWGFYLDLPEGFGLVGGDGKDRFAFASPEGDVSLDLVAYAPGRFASPGALNADVAKRLGAVADTSSFDYRGRAAAVSRISFAGPAGPTEGWALAVELGSPAAANGKRGILLALAYGAAGAAASEPVYLSALDSIAPAAEDRAAPGPISVFAFPSEGQETVRFDVEGSIVEAPYDATDKEASKALIEREFAVLKRYSDSPLWKEAWARFYRAIWRDSYARLAGIAFAAERSLSSASPIMDRRAFAERALAWVQGFRYERDLLGTDFVDLVSAAAEGRGDCDSRALLYAIILQRANIDAILMVSRDYAHAMAAASVEGSGAKFRFGGADWIVAETTAKVALGMIGQNVADPAKWLGIDFPSLPPAR